LQQYIALAVKTLNERKPGVPRRHVVVTPDNVPLNIYASNQQRSETVIFVNAVGMPLEFADRLREAVEKDYRFITWESRGIPSPIEDIDKIDIDTDAHVKDLVCICEHFGLKKVHVIGWCSGAYIAYQARNVSYIASLTLINGAYGLVESIGAETAFARNLRQVLPVIAASRDNADRFHAFCFARSVDDDSDTATGSRQAVEILGATDPSLVHLTSLPFESPESLYRYSRVICALGVTVQRSEIMPLDLPCHVIVGSGDETINPQESRMFTELHEGVKYSEIAGMDHYGVYNHPTLLSTITTYLGSLKNLVEDQTPSSTE
jgi:pimeloyl-ACP methyl ester carboxylesterase